MSPQHILATVMICIVVDIQEYRPRYTIFYLLNRQYLVNDEVDKARLGATENLNVLTQQATGFQFLFSCPDNLLSYFFFAQYSIRYRKSSCVDLLRLSNQRGTKTTSKNDSQVGKYFYLRLTHRVTGQKNLFYCTCPLD